MDTKTARLLHSIDAYLEHPPHGVPEGLVENINATKEMLSAPRFSEESPGEKTAREVAEATMPEEVSNEYYSNETETPAENVGVFSQT